MTIVKLLKRKLIEEVTNNKYLCKSCNKTYTKLGIPNHYFYCHEEEGNIIRKNISLKLEGKTKKELSEEKKLKNIKVKKQEQQVIKIFHENFFLNRNEIIQFLDKKYGNNDLSNISRWLKVKYIVVYNSIIKNTNYLDISCSYSERLYHILYNIYTPILCKCCTNKVIFKSLYYGYYEYCSTKCMSNDIDIKKKKQQTCLKKYNKSSYSKTEEFKEKVIQTNLKKFGVNYPSQSSVIIEKMKKVFINNYDVDSPMKVEDVKDKNRNTFLRHCNDDSNFLENIKNKMKSTFNNNFGCDHFMKCDSELKRRIINIQKQKFELSFNKILKSLKLDIIEEYQHAHYNHSWKCLKCNNIFHKSWNVIQRGFLCQVCYPKENDGKSILEKEVVYFIKEVLHEQIVENTRNVIKPKELDIYIPSKKIAIEFNGLYWHSEEQLNDKNYHINKTSSCNKKGIRLIHIFEDEWVFKQDIVKNRLIQILNLSNKNRIHARKCIIKEISPKQKNEFLEKFHLQGKDSSVIKLGAFYEDQLVSVMTFSKGNISKGSKSKIGIWELNRFCSDYNYHIPGIASKLLTNFKRNYQWKEIFSYADRRWSEGNLYDKLGFELEGETGINYWYIKNFHRIHRFALRKRPDEPKDIPEWKLRQNEGLYRIWDCGSLKFKMTHGWRNNG